jgi:4-phospho-D-threonate 3-dehydrogenase / 4-phospho-D-erythronate 3-dehydrogenase
MPRAPYFATSRTSVTLASGSPYKPRVGITFGDPAGVGPEITLKAVADQRVLDFCSPIIIGDAQEIRRQALVLGLRAEFIEISLENYKPGQFDEPVIVNTDNLSSPVEWGMISASSGAAAISAIEAAVKLCLAGSLDAVTTSPINKESIKLAGSPFPGHTEMIASLCGTGDALMCFFAENLRVFLLTVHCSLSEAIKQITKQHVLKTLMLADRELKRFGVTSPRIAVAGLNPHAGEHGLFGHEDEQEIKPAIMESRSLHNIDASGPFPGDTIFIRAARGEFDAVAACYHDQGLIPVKCLSFGTAVNATLGLPIIRTSVDHGTAFDIAGRGVADHRSLVEAIKLAASLVQKIKSKASL